MNHTGLCDHQVGEAGFLQLKLNSITEAKAAILKSCIKNVAGFTKGVRLITCVFILKRKITTNRDAFNQLKVVDATCKFKPIKAATAISKIIEVKSS